MRLNLPAKDTDNTYHDILRDNNISKSKMELFRDFCQTWKELCGRDMSLSKEFILDQEFLVQEALQLYWGPVAVCVFDYELMTVTASHQDGKFLKL